MNMVYYGAEGLTSTSANFLANKAKEINEGIQKELDSVTFENVNYKVAGTDVIDVNSGKSREWLDENIKKLRKMGELKAFIAWLREAIKEKEEAVTRLRNLNLTNYLLNKKEEVKYPPVLDSVTSEDIIESMAVGDRQRYLSLEAQAANIGQYIHPDGALSKARKKIRNINGKTEVSGVGTPSLTVITYSSSIPVEELDQVYLGLQEEFRNLQAQLNGMKHEILVKQDKENDRLVAEYRQALQEYEVWQKSKQADFNQFVSSESQKISELRIIIPDNLRSIYEFVKNS